MTVSIRSVLHNTQFKRADPVVEVEGKDLDTPVRWVFTNEREDVSSFLSGGEMLIIEGQRSARRRLARHARTICSKPGTGWCRRSGGRTGGGCGADAGRTGVCGQAAWVDVDWFEISRTFLSTSVRASIPLSCTNRCTCNWRWTQCPLHYVRIVPYRQYRGCGRNHCVAVRRKRRHFRW